MVHAEEAVMLRAGVFSRKVKQIARRLLSLEEGELRAVLAMVALDKGWMWITMTREEEQGPQNAVITPSKEGYGFTDFDGTTVGVRQSLQGSDFGD
jgi:hypothetical protein